MANVESLELQIKGNAKSAEKSINALISTLDRLKKATGDGCGLSKVTGEMSKMSGEMSKIKKLNIGLSSSNKTASKSFSLFSSKALKGALSLHAITNAVSSWIKSSNDYVENLNLFTVSMGEYSESAQEYAETVSEAMGIDPSTWMRNQGVFMTLATGFGVTSDRAATMSEQLTQLGYDLSSFFNITVEDAMQKLQSGVSGELEPLRRLGFDLSQAKLEAIALSLGIDKTFDSMTQAEKAQLRYYAIMNQVTTAQGDMARTLNSPANQLRILREQLNQAARALGNIFIPALNAVLPYAIAVIRVIRDLATEIAKLFGYKPAVADYTGLSSVSAGASDASEALDEASGSAAKLKKTLLGIDELNVMNDPKSGGGGAGASAGGDEFAFDLPTYDFMGDISSKTDKIYKTLKKILTPVKKIIQWIGEYKDFILMGLGISAVVALWGKLKLFWAWFKGLKLVSLFIDGFKYARYMGDSTFTSIGAGIANVRNSLSLMQKTAITAIAGFLEFKTVSDNVKELAMGCDDAGDKLTKIGVVVTAAAAAMYVALGPAGLAVAALIGFAGYVDGVSAAAEQMRTELNMELFFDGLGVSIESLAGKLKLLSEEFGAQNGQIVEWGEQIASNNETIEQAMLKIDGLTILLGKNGPVTREEIDEIKGQFASLYESIKSNMSLSEEVIMTALVGALQRATPEISAQSDLLIGEYQRYVRETQGRAEELKLLIDNGYDQLVGKQKDDPAYQEIMANITAWYTELGTLSGSMSTAGYQWQKTVEEFNAEGIDFGDDVEAVTNSFGEITDAAQVALEDVRTARDTVMMEIENSIAYASQYKPEDLEMLFDIKEALADDYAKQEAAILSELDTIFNSIQTEMIEHTGAVRDAAVDEWYNMSGVEKNRNGIYETEYVKKMVSNYQDNIVDPIGDAINESYEALKMDGSEWASDAMTTILESMFSKRVIEAEGVSTYVLEYGRGLEEILSEILGDVGEAGAKSSSAAGEAITEGLAEGIEAATSDATDAATEVVEEIDEAVRDASDINSPSRLFATEGGYMMDGLIKGIKDKVKDLKSSMSDAIDSAFSTKSATSYGESFGQSLANAMVKAIKNTTFPKLKGTVQTTSDGTATIKFNAYAAGGFPTDGEMFIAREAGPEMVGTIGNRTAVANNDQIVESVSRGVYQAVVYAMGQSGGTQVVEAKVNDKVLFEVVVDRNRRETMRTGASPLLGGV